MNYCRGLTFEGEPDYRYILSLFDGCMERNNFDPRTIEFIWNKNRLMQERQTLKEQMMKVINKPKAKKAVTAAAAGEDGNNNNQGDGAAGQGQ